MIDARACLQPLAGSAPATWFFSLPAAERLGLAGIARLPFSLKCILENLLRQQALGQSDGGDVERLAGWLRNRGSDQEIAFRPARMLIPESSGLPLFGDLAALRDAMVAWGGDPRAVGPRVPVDFIVDHSASVDVHGQPGAVSLNLAQEVARNGERYRFLRWAAQAFDRLRVFPPGSGICHQINLEHLARVVDTVEIDGCRVAIPDSLVGMDSHTPMVNGMGIVGWGVGGLEGGSAALGEPVTMLIPAVVGIRLLGRLPAGATATDLVLAVTQRLRQERLQGQFIEYTGPGLSALSLANRATVANMTPECGATMGFFPIDAATLAYLRQTGRDAAHIALVERYARAQGLWWDEGVEEPAFTRTIAFDLAQVEPSVAGPNRPHQRVPLAQAAQAFRGAFPERPQEAGLRDGDIVLAAITSCTNTSNPALMLAAGLLARNAVRRGLRPPPWVKTSLAPGSRVVAAYLSGSGLQDDLDRLGFHVVGFSCMTCMGNSGPLLPAVAEALAVREAAVVAVLSGNRNFEARVHAQAQANFLASPPLVVAYALAGSILTDLTRDPLGHDAAGRAVFLADLWPQPEEVEALVRTQVTPQRFGAGYADIAQGPAQWQAIESVAGLQFPWGDSTFIRRPPFFADFERRPAAPADLHGARVLGMFGDMLTTDHISPIGEISPGTPADTYLRSLGIARQDYVNYAARRLNHDVMVRGTFANIRLRNEMTPGREGSWTVHHPSGALLSVHAAAQRYAAEGVPLVIVAGREYGAGSSRDWAAKGTRLLGVRAVIAESFERIHRSNLARMGVLPLEFTEGTTRRSLGLDGSETFDILGLAADLQPLQLLRVVIHAGHSRREIALRLRLDTRAELQYFLHGGLMPCVLRQYLDKENR